MLRSSEKGTPRGATVGPGCCQASALVPASSAKQSTRRIRSGGTSRGQYHSPLRLFLSQARGTSTSKTVLVCTRPPCRLTTCRIAQEVLFAEHNQTAGNL